MEERGDRVEPNNCSGLQCGELGSDQSEQNDPEGGKSGQALGLEVPGPIWDEERFAGGKVKPKLSRKQK